jgi:2-oxoglutarate ferredoxin oxidoreductase subunit alpha
MSRIAKGALSALRKEGKKIGLIRPVTLWPFPRKAFALPKARKARYLVAEMSYGQMLEDVQLVVNGKAPVDFIGRSGGGVLTEADIIRRVKGLK